MARISKYQNDKTEESIHKIDRLTTGALNIHIEEVELFQLKNGISDVLLAKAIGIDKAAISRWKTDNRPLSDTTFIALHLMMQAF